MNERIPLPEAEGATIKLCRQGDWSLPAYGHLTYRSMLAPMAVNAPSSITIRWENGATEEEKLERIITQKYLAIFPNGQEAWTEWRRTGYPRQIVVAENKTNSAVLIGNGYDLGGVRRLPYPRTEYEQNGENLHNAISQYLGGVDNAATKVWWDKKSK